MSALTVPGKLFVMGEYSILEGGTAILAAIQPQYTYFQSESGFKPAPHPDSPLGQWLTEFASDLDLKRVPHSWHGSIPVKDQQGFGSSTAELIAAWQSQKVPASPAGLLGWYRTRFPRQSGADLMVQLQALGDGLGLYEVKPDPRTPGAFEIQRLKTGRVTKQLLVLKGPAESKLATHEAMKTHSRVGFDQYKLDFFQEKLRRLLVEDQTHRDWKLLTDWALELGSYGLESAFGREIREALIAIPGVFGAKGCGAGLNDSFLMAVSSDFDREKLARVCAQYGLRLMGSLHELTAASAEVVRAFAPVNIAWIKYMGKEAGRPTNPSYSITLDHVGTLTEIECRSSERGDAKLPLTIHWNEIGYVPPESGREKIEAWMRDEKVWAPLMDRSGFMWSMPSGEGWITSFNSAPAATGIATSASGFAAMAMAWSACMISPERRPQWYGLFSSTTPEGAQLRARIAQAASLGSGSAGRSIEGPWVEWNSAHEFVPHRFDSDWVDCVFLLEKEPKKIPSSQAHARVRTSPHFKERLEQLPARIRDWKAALELKTMSELRRLTLDEAMDMHHLFHTSQPAFTYLNDASKRWIELARNPDSAVPSKDYVVTLDAGSNVHWFVRPKELKLWRTWFKFKDPKVEWIEGPAGSGARYA